MPTPRDILQQYWGYPAFREPQEAVINAVLAGNDALAILPTGAGKSVCYQVPALILNGMCLVVSPLIALMRDQVEQLQQRHIPSAAVFSGMSQNEIDVVLENAAQGMYKLLYVSPERLRTKLFQARLLRMQVSLVAIDEAHCISQWGYDFRPSYLEIATLREVLPKVPFLALTASATPEVQKDIVERLQLRKPVLFRKSFLRPNIGFAAIYQEGKAAKLLELAAKIKGSGIIYAGNRKLVETIAALLVKNGHAASYYHAGLKGEERTRRQQEWQQGKVRIMACTNAFGMGIDKADVRFVIHADVPDSLEAYYQEAGRAGRDGKRSFAIILYKQVDLSVLSDHIDRQFPDRDTVARVYHALCNYLGIAMHSGEEQSFPFDIVHFCQQYGLSAMVVLPALKLLQQDGYLLLSESIYVPSRVKFSLNSSELYRYQVEHSQHDTFIKLMLRSYGGIIDYYTTIREPFLATKMKMKESEVVKLLKQLAYAQVLQYEPANDKPTVTFLMPRVPEERLVLDEKRTETLRKMKTDRVQAMVGYIRNEDICRQVFIANYFGEKDAQPCGICDHCLDEKRRVAAAGWREMILHEFRNKSAVNVQHLTALSPAVSGKEAILEQIRLLVDEKVLILNDDHTVRLP